MRADAARNREKIVEAARALFRERGYDVPMDDIAKAAGVGPGTLYRHFPNRDSLLDALLQSWVDRVAEALDRVLAEDVDARTKLLAWFQEYVALISLHRGGPAKITSAMEDPDSPMAGKCQVLRSASEKVIADLADALRPGVDSHQLYRLVGGVATVADQGGLPQDAVRPMLEVIADGLLRAPERAGRG